MIKPLKRFYRLAPNGKMELLGRDGYEHAFISLCVMLGVPGLCYWKWGLIGGVSAAVIAYIYLRIHWWVTEWWQERKMLKKDKTRKKVHWTDWSPARMVDMKYALVVDTPILLIWVSVYVNVIGLSTPPIS